MKGRKACSLTVALTYISDLIDCESLGKHTGGPAGHVNNASWNKTWSPESKSFCILVWYSVIHFIRVLCKWMPPWCMTFVCFYVRLTLSGGILLWKVSTVLKRVLCYLIINNNNRPDITYRSEATILNRIVSSVGATTNIYVSASTKSKLRCWSTMTNSSVLRSTDFHSMFYDRDVKHSCIDQTIARKADHKAN